MLAMSPPWSPPTRHEGAPPSASGAPSGSAVVDRDARASSALPALPVLLVEDDVKFALLVLRAFARAGLRVLHSQTGDAALHAVRSEGPFCAVVLDVMIPHPDGIEVCRHLRRMDAGVPVIAISARCGAEHRDRARAAGADAFLGKPFPLAELVQLTRTLVAEAAERPPEVR